MGIGVGDRVAVHTLVDLRVIGARDHQCVPGDISGDVSTALGPDGKLFELRIDLRGDDGDVGTGVEELPDLSRRHRAATDDEHWLAGESKVDRERSSLGKH